MQFVRSLWQRPAASGLGLGQRTVACGEHLRVRSHYVSLAVVYTADTPLMLRPKSFCMEQVAE